MIEKRSTETTLDEAIRNPAFQALVDIVSDADKKWFLAHPNRKCRIRPIRRGDVPEIAIGSANHVIVYQAFPGARIRCPVETFDFVPDDDKILYAALKRILKRRNPDLWRGIQKMRRAKAEQDHADAE